MLLGVIVVGVVILVVALVLGGNSSSTKTSATAAATTQPAASASSGGSASSTTSSIPATTMDGVFVKTVRDHAPAFADSTDGELIALAHQVCDTIAKSDVQTVMQQLASDPTFTQQEMRQAGFFVGAGVAAYCPQYDAQVSAMANGG